MSRVVVDASVAVAWVVRDAGRELYADKALALLRGILEGSVQAVQPPHWIAEVGAVLARLQPEHAAADVANLCALELPVLSEPAHLLEATRLAVELQCHVFDTWYHALALLEKAELITADDRYFARAWARGSMRLLAATNYASRALR